MLAHRKEMERLFQVEYGDRPEVVIRMLGVGLGGVLIYVYDGWLSAWLWPASFLFLHAVFYLYLRKYRSINSASAAHFAGVLFVLILIAFLWMPAYLAGTNDPGLSFTGTILVATVVIFLIRRADTYVWMITAEIAIVVAALMWILICKLQEIADPVSRTAVVVATVAISGYIAQAMRSSRRTRLDGEAAAEKAVQEQKMSAIGQLAGGVAHDFNNVLTAISGNLELHGHLTDPRERTHVLEEAQIAAKRAAEVVRQLLIYARKAPMQRVQIDANDSVRQMLTLARSLVPQWVRIDLHLQEQPAQVIVDDSQFLTAMLNIVVNAVDAMPKGGQLSIASCEVDVASAMAMIDGSDLAIGRYVKLSFTDTGNGIPDATLNKVIEPFFTTKPPGKGTGLGLPMVLGFASESGGGLDIDSSDSGTAISLFLPLTDSPS
ncbi:sensor histidine kinase [Primorskyibacter sp. 2E233]|uniref:sensor histidine kinase n=1 Tax=Primorskyibacter sp. 2E233 TaxID=3413431 RepID=UPI003BF1ACA1